MPFYHNTTSTSPLILPAFLRQGGCMFRLEILKPGGTEPENNSHIIEFPAFIDSIQDSFQPSWGSYNDMGRGDPKVMLESYQRTISLSFKIVALDRKNTTNTAHALYSRLNELAKLTNPNYIAGKGFVGRFLRFTIARLYVNEYGYVSSMNVAIDNATGWQTTREGQGEWPIVSTVDMTINWIGDKRPDGNNSNVNNYNTIARTDEFEMRDL